MSQTSRKWGSLHPDEPEAETLTESSLTQERQWELYRTLVLNRRLEDLLANLYRRGRIVGGAYSSRGQEGVSVGSATALEPGDLIGPLIRNLGAQLVRGVEPRHVLALHMGKASVGNRAKDNLPPTDLEKGILGPIAMLGSLLSVVGGALLACRMKGGTQVGMTWIGDGGTSTGEWHEGMNMAAVLSLPLVVVCEHNGYAYSTPTARQMKVKDIAVRAAGYGIPGETVDGNDALAVYEAARRAVSRARSGAGPTLVEVKTFRMKGHAEHDDASYVPRELLAQWAERDPILRFEKHLLAKGWATEETFKALAGEIDAGLEADLEWATSQPLPLGEEALDGAYAASAARRVE